MNSKLTIFSFLACLFLMAYSIDSLGGKTSCDLCDAVESNDLRAASIIAKDRTKLSEVNEREIWPLFLALKNRNEKMVRLLLDAGVDVNYTDRHGMSALIGTVMANRPSMTKVLIDAGANPNIQSMHLDSNAIHLAVGYGRSEVLKELLKSEVDLDKANSVGVTALMSAAANENEEIVKILLEAGANPNHFDGDNMTAMHIIAMSKETSLIDLMVKYGADINAQKNNGATPLIAAVSTEDNTGVIKAILKLKADPLLIGEGLTALHVSVIHTSLKNLMALLEQGLDPDLVADGLTPLSLAAVADNAAAARMLIESGANPDLQVDGVSPLAYAVMADNLGAVRMLVEYGANPMLKLENESGRSLVELAADKPEILKFLNEADVVR